MLRRVVGWFVLVPLCAALVIFALANPQPVVLKLNPLAPADAAAGAGMPLFVVLYIALLLGVFLGGGASWFAQGHHRRHKRVYRREAERLNREVDGMRRGEPPAALDDLAKF